MNAAALNRAVLTDGLAQIAQVMGTYHFTTDQTAQSDQRIEFAEQFGAPPGSKSTSRDPKLTSESTRHPPLCVAGVGAAPLDSTDAYTSDGAPQP
jgi:hypothetical protein